MTNSKGLLPFLFVVIVLVFGFYYALIQSVPADHESSSFSAETNLVDSERSPSDESPFDEELEKKILEIAGNYKNFGIVDDEVRWAPWLCRMPMPALARFSKSDDEETHGEKLYLLYAKDRDNYLTGDEMVPEVGQIVVKESWRPVEVDEEIDMRDWRQVQKETVHTELGEEGLGNSYFPIAEKDGKSYKADELAGLYIMMKLDPETKGTDNGWVYATVTADGKTVTAIGNIESCISCHQDAPHDRLFGLSD